jgi:hypothetical protein
MATVAPCFAGPSMLRSLPANLVRAPKPASPRRTGSGGNTGNALAVHRVQARQSGEPAFAAPLGLYMYSVPGGLTIEEGKTDYAIELGKAFQAPQLIKAVLDSENNGRIPGSTGAEHTA